MKKAIALSFLMLQLSSAKCQGLQFEPENTPWETVLQKAATEGKIIFVAVYSLSCENCVHMMEQVYPLETVGAVFNDKYVNIKIDYDSQAGADFTATYSVRALPTYYFLDAKGKPLHWENGARTESELISIGQHADDPAYQYFAMKARFEQGNRSPDMLKRLTFLAQDLSEYDLLDSVHLAYLATQKDWLTPENMDILFAGLNAIGQPTFQFLLQHQAAFVQALGEQKVGAKIDEVSMNSVSMIAYNYENRDYDLEKARDYAAAYLPPDLLEKTMSTFQVNQYKNKEMTAEYLAAAVRHFDQYPCYNPFFLNNIARSFYELSSDKAQLAKAVNWSLQAQQLNAGSLFCETTAALYYKMGDLKNAEIQALKAIEVARQTGADVSASRQLLEQIK